MGLGHGLKPLTVSELIEYLRDYDDDCPVFFESHLRVVEPVVEHEQPRWSSAVVLSQYQYKT